MLLGVAGVLWILSWDISGEKKSFQYGVSFNRHHAMELGLDWKKTYLALLDDLGAKRLRLSAHWHFMEPEEGQYDFSEIDFQVKEAEKRNATVILAMGRRLPVWPECHPPDWVEMLPVDQQKEKLLKLIEVIVNRYKNYSNIQYWQVENEYFLTFFSRSKCVQSGMGEWDEDFLKKEIELVRKLDPTRQIIITDSGEFGTWYKAYRNSDVFGTSMYLYIWSRQFGPIRYPIIPAFFRIKHSLIRLIYGSRPAMVIELSTEPWLLQPIVETPIDIQLQRMGVDKFNEMIKFSSKTGFDTFYLWGAEWWYWLKINGHPEHWERAKEIFAAPKAL